MLPEDSEIDIKENKQTDAFQVFYEKVKACNEELAILILGQTMTTLDGSSQSQAEVHLKTLEEITKDDMLGCTNWVNDVVLPILIKLGYPIKEGYSFEFHDAKEMTVQEKKERFRNLVVPAVDEVYADLMAQYQEVSELVESDADANELAELRTEYKASNNQELLMALKPHPKSIAVAQAAMESSWATSRFTRVANNLFGVWSFDEDEPRVAAGEQRGDKTIWVKKYSSFEDSIRDYYRTLARSDAYKEFRQLKMTTDDPYALVKKLDRYSEKGAEYGKELSSIMKFNKFDKYDAKTDLE